MRVTKDTLRTIKRGMRQRIVEIVSAVATHQLTDELHKAFPGLEVTPSSNHEALRILLLDMLDNHIPAHWHDYKE